MRSKKIKELEAQLQQEITNYYNLRRENDGLRTVQEQQLAQLQDADDQIVALEDELRETQAELGRLRNPLAFNPPDNEIFVVVTEASKTKGSHVVKHAWGPYLSRNKAQASAQRFKRNAEEEGHVTKTSVLKIISS